MPFALSCRLLVARNALPRVGGIDSSRVEKNQHEDATNRSDGDTLAAVAVVVARAIEDAVQQEPYPHNRCNDCLQCLQREPQLPSQATTPSRSPLDNHYEYDGRRKKLCWRQHRDGDGRGESYSIEGVSNEAVDVEVVGVEKIAKDIRPKRKSCWK